MVNIISRLEQHYKYMKHAKDKIKMLLFLQAQRTKVGTSPCVLETVEAADSEPVSSIMEYSCTKVSAKWPACTPSPAKIEWNS